MQLVKNGQVMLHYRQDGDRSGPPLVFANSLGTDLRLWDEVVARLPRELHIIRYDKRGHGLSSCPKAPYSMGSLIADAETLLDHLKIVDCVFVGLSIGGMIAQGLAAKRPDLIGAMVLSNTGAKIGTRAMWDERIAAVRAGGISSLAPSIMQRWFSKSFRATPQLELWENMLVRQPDEGYIGCSDAIAGTDFFSTTSALGVPTLGIAGSEDGSTPPDLVRETVNLIEGSGFHLIKGAGHLPCVENPEEYARVLHQFLCDTGHI